MKHIIFQLSLTAINWCWLGAMLASQNWLAAAITAPVAIWLTWWDAHRMPVWVSWL